jgi:hypothetical protein
MATSGQLDPLTVRRGRIESVTRSARRQRGFVSDQSEVWDNVAELLLSLDTESSTQAMHDGYAGRSDDLEAYVDALRPVAQQAGALIAIDGQWTSVELFSHPLLYAAHAGKIIQFSAMVLVSRPAKAASHPPATEAEAVLQELAGSEVQTYSAVGLGATLRFQSARWRGSAVRDEEEIVHLVAYAS